MGDAFPVRRAQVSDLESLFPLLDLMGSIEEAMLSRRFERIVSDAQHLVIVSTEGSRTIGYAWAQNYGPHLRSGFSCARLHDLAVEPDLRRRGIGRSLFMEVVKWCEGSGVSELQWQASRAAAPFYESLGLRGDTRSDLEEYPHYEVAIGTWPNAVEQKDWPSIEQQGE